MALYTPDMRASHAAVSTMDHRDLANLAFNSLKAGTPQLLCEMVVSKAMPKSKQVWARQATTCKPYCDVDRKLPARPSDEEIAQMETTYKQQWAAALDKGLSEPIDISTIKVATRHRFVATGMAQAGVPMTRVFKVSFRFFLPGYSTNPKTVEYYMNQAKLFDGADSPFDKSVYSTTRKMCMVFCRKSVGDPAVLTPTESMDTLNPLDYLISYTDPNWTKIAPTTMAPSSEASSSGSNSDEEMTEAPIDDKDFAMLKPILTHMGFSQIQIVSRREDEGIRFIGFSAGNRSDCPCCHQPHDHNNWCLTIKPSHFISVKNQSNRCTSLDLFADRPSDSFTKALVERPSLADRHKDYAEKFADMGMDYLFPYAQDGRDFLTFNGAKWETVKATSMRKEVSRSLEALIQNDYMQIKSTYLPAARHFKLQSEVGQLTDGLKTLDKAHSNVGKTQFVNNILTELETVCGCDEAFNMQHLLFHCNDCTIDLSNIITGDEDPTIRPTEPGDRNTFTSGYNYYDFDGEADMQAIETFYSQIFPIEEERKYFQKFGGACISGVCDAKVFCSLSDMREGNNGKSACVALMNSTFGDYAAVAKKDMLYASSLVNQEGPTPFTRALMGKRLATFEELDPTKRFNTDTIKELTGGYNVSITARGLNKPPVQFELQLKIIMAYNEGNGPRRDLSDDAFNSRDLIIPCRSKFTTDVNKLDFVNAEAPTFKAVPNWVRTTGKSLRAANLRWLIEGYKMYRKEGIDMVNLPERMHDFKGAVLLLQSPVRGVLEDMIVYTGKKESFVDMEQAFERFMLDPRSGKRFCKRAFRTAFKMFVNRTRMNSFQECMFGSVTMKRPRAQFWEFKGSSGQQQQQQGNQGQMGKPFF